MKNSRSIKQAKFFTIHEIGDKIVQNLDFLTAAGIIKFKLFFLFF